MHILDSFHIPIPADSFREGDHSHFQLIRPGLPCRQSLEQQARGLQEGSKWSWRKASGKFYQF